MPAAAQVPSATPQRLRPARPPSSTMAEQGAAAAALSEHPRGATTAAAAALALNGPQLGFSARDTYAEAFGSNETAGRSSDYAARMKNILLGCCCCCRVKLSVTLLKRGISMIVGVMARPAACLAQHKHTAHSRHHSHHARIACARNQRQPRPGLASSAPSAALRGEEHRRRPV